MKARLIAVTRPLPEIGLGDSPEELIVYCGRVSNPSNQLNTSTSLGLLSYLIRHQHWSPFEMVHAVVEIECPRDIARQVLRHRSFSFQEFSQRYAEVLAFLRREARRQDRKNRQNSTNDLPRWKRWVWAVMQELVVRVAAGAYSMSLRLDIAKECARVLLPEGLTPSRVYMSGTIRSFIHYLNVREGNGTQLEHIELAGLIREQLAKEFPICMKTEK